MAALLLGLGVALSGCMVSQSVEPSSDANLTPRDRKLLANPPYAQAQIPQPYLRHIVGYHRKEAPGTIVIDPDARYLYLVQSEGKAIRYGVTVGEEALSWSGVAKVGRMEEWPSWTPTADNQPEYIGHAISSGCIRLTTEDVIDLYSRVRMGAPVVVLRTKEGDSPTNPRIAFTGNPHL